MPQEYPKNPFNIAVVGGGIGGVILAIGLLKHGVPVQIYESTKGFGEIGAGIAFGPNAMRAFGLISPDLLDAFRRHATYDESTERSETVWTFRYGEDSRNSDGKKAGDFMFCIDDDKNCDSWTQTRPRGCVHRAKFLNEIIKLVPEDVPHFNKSLVSLEELPNDGGVRLHFADGSTALASAVVGADGIKSKTRQCLYGDKVKPVYSGYYVYRALIPLAAYEASLGRQLAANGHVYSAYGRAIVSYPVGEDIINVGAVVREPIWDYETWLKPSSEEELRSALKAIHPALVELLARFSSRDKWAIFDVPHSEKYCKGRVCLLGDSAHASVPHMAGGAGQAVEDAYVLSNLLSNTQRNEDLPKVLEAYDAVRRPRSQQLLRYSRINGQAFSLSEEGVGDDNVKLQKNMTDRWRWLWDEDLEKHLGEALAMVDTGECVNTNC